MKKFKLVGPETTRKFETEDDEMVVFYAIKEADYMKKIPEPKHYDLQNEVVTKTE